MSSKNVLMLSTNKFPDGDAGSIRELALAKIIKQNSYNVFVIGLGKTTKFQLKKSEDISYCSFRYGNSFLEKIKMIVLFKYNLNKFIKKENINFNSILITDIPINALFFIKKYAKKHNIQLIHNSVEWYSKEEFRYGNLSLSYILKNKYNNKWIDEKFSVIAISTYLENHFKLKHINTIRIPVVLDVKNIPYEKSINYNKLVFIYAGAPGKKDYLNTIIKGFALLEKKELQKIELRIIGVTKKQLQSICDVEKDDIEYLENTLVALGRVSHTEVLRNLREADFTVLLRSEEQRCAKAGFPTKVVESLASATPVICNLTSDLSMYIKDANNGFIVQGCSSENLSKTIKKCLLLVKKEKETLQKNARKTAEEEFDYRLYTGDVKRMLDTSYNESSIN